MRIGIVVPCTDSKRASTPPIRLRDHAGDDRLARIRNWLAALGAATQVTPAIRLYKGVGWAASDDLMAAPHQLGLQAVPMIVSAGYGAVRPNEPLANYSATFLAKNPDSVPKPRSTEPTEESRGWWRDINSERGSATPLADLATSVDGLIVAASAVYIDALGDDLAEAVSRTPTVIYCSGTPKDPSIAACAPGFDRRLREGAKPFVDANDQSLNQRVAEATLRTLGQRACDVEEVRELLAAQMDRPRPIRYGRQASTDEEISRFIAGEFAQNATTAKSTLLRRWRDQGNACEQRRFGRLYEEVRRTSPEEDEVTRVNA